VVLIFILLFMHHILHNKHFFTCQLKNDIFLFFYHFLSPNLEDTIIINALKRFDTDISIAYATFIFKSITNMPMNIVATIIITCIERRS